MTSVIWKPTMSTPFITSLLDDICDMEANDEYSIHYEFVG